MNSPLHERQPEGRRYVRIEAKGKMRREKEEARAKVAPRLIFTPAAYLPHPEQDAQQSAEGQHEAFAAFTAAVRPNATTASNRIALILFMTFSFLE